MVKNPAASAGDMGLICGLGRFPEVRNGNLLQYFCLKNSMGRGDWHPAVHGAAKSQTAEHTKAMICNEGRKSKFKI